jgi:hypothetical protein
VLSTATTTRAKRTTASTTMTLELKARER